MRRLLVALLPLAAIAAPAAARVPRVDPPRTYYGPIRICTPLFAFDVRAGEGYLAHNGDHIVRFGHHHFSFGQRWLYADPAFRDIVHPMGTLDVPGLGRLERIELSSRNNAGRQILYLYDTHDGGPFPKVQMGSDSFDGSDRDLALFGRLAFGERRIDMCAEVPDALRPRPEREDRDAFWVSPERPAGPLTLCWAGLALDIRAGEAAIPFWVRGWELFGVAAGRYRVTISGSIARLRDAAGQPFNRPFAASPEFVVRPVADQLYGMPPALRSADGAAARYVRLQRPVNLPHPEIAAHGGVTFAFSGPASDEEIAAFVGRLRPRAARDICFEETP